MRTTVQRPAQIQALIFFLLLPLLGQASSFVELTVEIEANDWGYWFFSDRIGNHPAQERMPTIFTKSQTARCVTGADSWMLGWNLPLEFYGVQYHPRGTNEWELHMTLKGRVTAIGACAKPEITAEVMDVIEK